MWTSFKDENNRNLQNIDSWILHKYHKFGGMQITQNSWKYQKKQFFFFFGSEMKYMLIMLIIIKFKDERSFPQDTKPNKSKTPPLYKENYR